MLSSALAAIAMAAVGGPDVDPQQLAKEAEAALGEGSDPLPRLPASWLKFSYVDGPALPPHLAKPNKVSQLYGKSRSKPLGGDGARAVSALVAHVGRLHRQREEALVSERDALGQVRELTEVIGKVDIEYQAVSEAVELMERELLRISDTRQYRGFGLDITGKGTLAARIKVLTAVVGRMALELEVQDDEKARLSAQLLELEFYSKLHGRLLTEAKEKVRQGNFVRPSAVRDVIRREEDQPPEGLESQEPTPSYYPEDTVLTGSVDVQHQPQDEPAMSEDQAATKVQSLYRGHKARKEVQAMKTQQQEPGKRVPSPQAPPQASLSNLTNASAVVDSVVDNLAEGTE